MKILKVLVLLVFIAVGLANRRHVKPARETAAKAGVTSSAVNQEILQNAERLAETLRNCQKSAQKNKETK